MKNFILTILTLIFLTQCCSNKGLSNDSKSGNVEDKLQGFVFIDLSKIYHHKGSVLIVGENKDTIVYTENKSMFINRTSYETIEEEYKYKKHLNIELFNAEYGFFILKCFGITDGFYRVEINGKVGLISLETYKEYLKFKDLKQYVIETYPIPTQQNPLRKETNDNSEIVNDFDKWTFIPVEIDGDWLKVIDNKDCYKGAAPSSNDIIGWIRWKKDGEFILKVAHGC